MTKKKCSSQAAQTDPQFGVTQKDYGEESQIYPDEVNQMVYDVDNKTDLSYHVGLDYLRMDTSAAGWTFTAKSTTEQTLIDTTASGTRWNPAWLVSLLIEMDVENMTKDEQEAAKNFEVRARINASGNSFFRGVRCYKFDYDQPFHWIHFGPYEVSNRETDAATTVRFYGWNGACGEQVKIKRVTVYYWK